jgi:hypothetical protein
MYSSQDFRYTDTSLAAPVHTAPQLTAATALDESIDDDGDGEEGGEGEDGDVAAGRRRLTQEMIIRESCEDIDEVGFVVKEWGTGLSALQTKLNVQLFEIFCCLAFEQVYVNSPKVKGDTLQALVADAVTGVRENYRHKTYAVAALFRHVPGGDWPAGVLELIEEKRAKTPTATFLKGARMQRRDPEAQRKCFFGELILSTAKKVCSVVIGHMNANYVAPEDLDSGLGMHDMYFALRRKVLSPLDINRLATESIRKGLKGQARADAIAEKSALMLSTIIYYDRAFRPSGWLAFLVLGKPAGEMWTQVCGREPASGRPMEEHAVRAQQNAIAGEVVGGGGKRPASEPAAGDEHQRVYNVNMQHGVNPVLLDALAWKAYRESYNDQIEILRELGRDDECRAAKEAHLLIVQERMRNRAAPLPIGLPAPAPPVIAVAPPHAQEDPVA